LEKLRYFPTNYFEMISTLKKNTGCIIIFAFLAIFSTIVHAYVLQGPHILQLMTEKMGRAKSLFISQKVILYNLQPKGELPSETVSPEPLKDSASHTGFTLEKPADTENPPVQPAGIQLKESLRYVFSDAFRSDSVSNDNQRVFVFSKGQTLSVIDGVISSVGETRFDLYKDLLLYRSRERLCERLTQLGIDVAISSLGKFENHLAFVVGAEYPDDTRPQVWVEMKTFQPLRMLIPGSSSFDKAGFLEIRYSRWQEIGKIWYPMRIEFMQDGKLVRAIEVSDYQIDPHFAKDEFDIARLKLQYRQSAATLDRTAENEGLSEVQKTIEEFKKIFE
jgi:hypothetical protein